MAENETPTLANIVNGMIDAKLVNLHTSMPGIIEKYDDVTKKADIKPVLQRQYIKDSETVTLPVIPNVPMCFFQTSTAIISVPVAVGDDVLIIFSERSIDNWKSKGGTLNPDDIRKFDLSDAIAIPILKPLGQGIPASSTDILIKNSSSEIKLSPNGTVEVETGGLTMILLPSGKITISNSSNELLSVLSELIAEIISARTATWLGPQALIGANFPTIKAKLDTFKA